MKPFRFKCAKSGADEGSSSERAASFFSPDYFSAKKRFVAISQRLGLEHHSLPLDAPGPTSEPLTIDVAIAGAASPRTALVVSSGVHGVEGFFGSAVQLAFLEGLALNWRPPESGAVVLIHAVNPFGFAWQRRFNEENIDLNRNFLFGDQEYSGSPPLCGVFRSALLPVSTRPRFGFSASRMAMLALRHGVQSFWATMPVGQYEFEDWLFFGGRGRAQSAQLLDRFLSTLLDRCEETIHLDLHTGLGRWADCRLLVSEPDTSENAEWWKRHFGEKNVSTSSGASRVYKIRGGLGAWLQAQFSRSRYRFATAEFGTYSPMRVISALVDELHCHAKLGAAPPDHRARQRLKETFVPRSPQWRRKTLETGVALIRRAAHVLWQ
jgi:predicted deacylase